MEPLLYCTIGRGAALCPRSPLTYLSEIASGFAPGRLALHPAITIKQRSQTSLLLAVLV